MASRNSRASGLPDCSKTAVGTCLTSVLMAHPNRPSMTTGTTRARKRARISRRRWMNSLTMMPRRREPISGFEGPELLAEPRLALLIHERDKQVLDGGLDIACPANLEPRAFEESLNVPGARAVGRKHDPEPCAHADDLLHQVPVGEKVSGTPKLVDVQLDHRSSEGALLH